MSKELSAQTGPAAGDGPVNSPPAARQEPQNLIQESIRYRRRAQEAERQAEAMEVELAALRQSGQEAVTAFEAQLQQARTEAADLRKSLEDAEHSHRLQRELILAGCADIETGMALARSRMASVDRQPEDLAAFARALLDEKPHLRSAPGQPAPSLPPPTGGAQPAGKDAPARAARRLAEQARASGNPGDILAYMRARRAVTA